jgi:hypothetical protein
MWPIKQGILCCSPSLLAGEGWGEGGIVGIEIMLNCRDKLG